ncbi:MAG: hemerythrin family protein [Firmicutes bacterium]|jgi:hemerythrin|nr:hemerythrin family protein [Bacillota bacterium]
MMWKEKYRIGVDLIDDQHRELFQRVSDFLQSVQQKGDWEQKTDKVKETLEFMQNYVVEHFEDEEAYQRQIKYPEYEEHKEIHAKFRAMINQYAVRFEEEGFTQELVQEFGGKLMTWLIMHVAASDQKIGAWVREQGGEGQ